MIDEHRRAIFEELRKDGRGMSFDEMKSKTGLDTYQILDVYKDLKKQNLISTGSHNYASMNSRQQEAYRNKYETTYSNVLGGVESVVSETAQFIDEIADNRWDKGFCLLSLLCLIPLVSLIIYPIAMFFGIKGIRTSIKNGGNFMKNWGGSCILLFMITSIFISQIIGGGYLLFQFVL